MDGENVSQNSIQKQKSAMNKIPWGGILSLIGGFFIQVTLGSFYSFGNMMTYMASYMRHHGSPNITYADVILVQSVWGMTQGISFPLSGFIIKYIGDRVAIFGGCSIFSLGAALTYFTINKNIWYVAFTYGFISAFGQGVALIPTMTICMKWFPKRKGMAMGIVVGGFGGGAFIFNQIQTAILNPTNINTDPNTGYFEDPELLNRVPGLMLILGGTYFALSLIAGCMIQIPPSIKSCASENSTSEEGRDVENSDVKSADTSDVIIDECSMEGDENIPVSEALKGLNFYLLWITRFSIVLITQLVAGFYKSFGQTFIQDDHFLSFVGAICSLFNCSGRLFYGLLMDKTTYKVAMSIETLLLTVITSTYFVSTIFGKGLFAAMTWGIFFTFPGTFAMMPAATIQAYGHKYGGTIYGLLFSADILNNLFIWLFSKLILVNLGYLGLFLISSSFGLLALLCTLFFPMYPSPSPKKLPKDLMIESNNEKEKTISLLTFKSK